MHMKLNIVSDKDKELSELVEIVESVETCCFRERGTLGIEREDIIAVDPATPIRLMKINQDLTGWVNSKRPWSIFERQLERYENNQSYYLEKYKTDEIPKKEIVNKLTKLETWFVCIVEPPPRVASGQKYMNNLSDWVRRESVKYKLGRSYYCDDEVLELLDQDKLLLVQKTIFENYEKVKAFYKGKESEHEEAERRKRLKDLGI